MTNTRQAVSLLPDVVQQTQVIAFGLPQSEADDALLRVVKTGEVIRIRGVVQGNQWRTIAVVPGVVVGGGG